MTRLLLGVIGWFLLSTPSGVLAQKKIAGEWAWTRILVHEGLSISYIFYPLADHENNGVVIKLVNTNDYAVEYRFKVIFRSENGQVVETVSGELEALETKTGDAAGLFWIPFTDGRSIGEVGLRGYSVVRKRAGKTPHPVP